VGAARYRRSQQFEGVGLALCLKIAIIIPATGRVGHRSPLRDINNSRKGSTKSRATIRPRGPRKWHVARHRTSSRHVKTGPSRLTWLHRARPRGSHRTFPTGSCIRFGKNSPKTTIPPTAGWARVARSRGGGGRRDTASNVPEPGPALSRQKRDALYVEGTATIGRNDYR